MKYTKPALILSISLIIAMGGCSANGPTFSPVKSLNPDEGVVYLYRKGNFASSLTNPHSVSIDEVKCCTLKNDGYLVLHMKPGKRILQTKLEGLLTPTTTLYLDVAAGQEYYVRWQCRLLPTYTPSTLEQLLIIPKETALNEISQTKLSAKEKKAN